MKIFCPHCGAALTDAHIDPTANIVTCDTCHTVFSPPDKLSQPSYAEAVSDMPVPERFTINKENDSLVISYRTSIWQGIIPVTIGVIASGVLYDVTLSIQIFNREPVSALFILLWLSALFTIFYGVYKSLDHTIIHVTDNGITVSHHPIKIPFTRTIPVPYVRQLFIKRQVRVMNSYRGSTYSTFDLYLVNEHEKHEKFLQGFITATQALYLEHQIENYLGIRDTYVEGQYS